MSQLPDPESLAITALRSRPLISVPVGGRISTRLGTTFPAIRLLLVGGSPRPTVNTGRAVVQVECWGNGSAPADEVAASNLALAVEGEIEHLPGLYPTGRLVGAWQEGVITHSSDPSTGRARYIVQIGLLTQ